MKIFHTADWHIGKIVHQYHMTEDQRYILDRFIEAVEDEKPDVILIAGDLYDRSVPPVEAVELLNNVFSKIILDLEIPIVCISGNHDSPDRVEFGSQILRNKGLYIDGTLKEEIKPIRLEDEYGPVNFFLVPYADPAVVRHITKRDDIHNHDDAMRVIIENIKEKMNKNERNILIAHSYIMGDSKLEESESERPLSIGGTEVVSAKYFEDFNYTALGHLHSPQRVGYDKVRYSGSLLKYSFSEVKQKKEITIVNLDKEGNITFESKNLKPIRDMREIKGHLEDLLNPEVYKETNVEDYLHITLLDEGELLDPIGKLRAVYPNVLKLSRDSLNRKSDNSKTSAGESYKTKNKLELFEDFYVAMTGSEFTEDKAEIVTKIINEVNKKEEVQI